MDWQLRVLVQVTKWLRRPPSRQFVWILTTVVVLGVALALVERFMGWPEWATVDRGARIHR